MCFGPRRQTRHSLTPFIKQDSYQVQYLQSLSCSHVTTKSYPGTHPIPLSGFIYFWIPHWLLSWHRPSFQVVQLSWLRKMPIPYKSSRHHRLNLLGFSRCHCCLHQEQSNTLGFLYLKDLLNSEDPVKMTQEADALSHQDMNHQQHQVFLADLKFPPQDTNA